MKCSNCGSDLSDDARFCPICGQKVVGNYSYQPEDDHTMNASYGQYQAQGSSGYQGGYQNSRQNNGQNSYQNGYQDMNQNNYQSEYQYENRNGYQGGGYQNGYQYGNYQQGYSVPPDSGDNGNNNGGGIKILLIMGIILLVLAVGVLIFLLVGRQSSSGSDVSEVSQDASGNDSDGSAAAEGTSEDTAATTEAASATTQATTEAASTTTAANSTGTYILTGSSSRYLTTSDLSPLSAWELKLARNEIYARHGRKFDNSDVQAYFDSQSWYYGYIEPDNFDESVFNTYESANVAFIKQYENGTAPSSAASINSGTSSSGSSGSSSSNSGSTSSDYILPNSSTTYLTYSDIAGLSSSQLRLARNEIYARHGRKFDDSELQAYFNSKSWYVGYIDPEDFSDSMLSDIEKSNIDLIKAYE